MSGFSITSAMDEPADIADMAAHHADAALAIALSAHAEQAETGEQRRSVTGDVICVDCYEVIPAKRLHAKPDARRCIFCQREFDGTRISEAA